MNSMSNVYLSDIKVPMEFYLFNKCITLVRIHRDGNMRVSFDSLTLIYDSLAENGKVCCWL